MQYVQYAIESAETENGAPRPEWSGRDLQWAQNGARITSKRLESPVLLIGVCRCGGEHILEWWCDGERGPMQYPGCGREAA